MDKKTSTSTSIEGYSTDSASDSASDSAPGSDIYAGNTSEFEDNPIRLLSFIELQDRAREVLANPDILKSIYDIVNKKRIINNKKYREQIFKKIKEIVEPLNIDLNPKDITKVSALVRDVFLLRILGIEDFVGVCMGVSSHNSWGGKNPEDSGKIFSDTAEVLRYTTELRPRFEEVRQKQYRNPDEGIIEMDQAFRSFFGGTDEDNASYPDLQSFLRTTQKTGIQVLLDNFVIFINKGINIDDRFKEITQLKFSKNDGTNNIDFIFDQDNIKKIFKPTFFGFFNKTNKETENTVKFLLCFSWDYCDRSFVRFSGGGVQMSRLINPTTVSEVVVQKDKKYYQKIMMGTFAIMTFLYYTFVLFGAYKLLIPTIERIYDAQSTYKLSYPGEQTAHHSGFIGIIRSFINVMYEIGAGAIIMSLDQITPALMETFKNILITTSTAVGQQQYMDCQLSVFTCVNDWFTGVSTGRATELATLQAQELMDIEWTKIQYNTQNDILKLKFDFKSGSYNIVTALHGLSFATILSLHLLFPHIYTGRHIEMSITSLTGSYLVNPLYGLYGLGGHLTLIFYPLITRAVSNSSVLHPNPNLSTIIDINMSQGRLLLEDYVKEKGNEIEDQHAEYIEDQHAEYMEDRSFGGGSIKSYMIKKFKSKKVYQKRKGYTNKKRIKKNKGRTFTRANVYKKNKRTSIKKMK